MPPFYDFKNIMGGLSVTPADVTGSSTRYRNHQRHSLLPIPKNPMALAKELDEDDDKLPRESSRGPIGAVVDNL